MARARRDGGGMEVLVLPIVLVAIVLVGTTLGGRYRVAPPVLLICMGALVALLPPFSHVVLDPEAVLLLFLPAILYRESINTSLREIRANFAVIALLAVGLVGATMVTVSLTAQALGVEPAAAWVLGAVLAPTDAAAVAGLAKRMPRKILTTLRAESLVNDGTALVLFSVALGLIAGGAAPGVWGFLERIGLSFLGGVVAGLLVGGVVVLLRRYVDDPLREGGLSVLTPFTSFLLAEEIHASGVLAVVVSGLVLAWASPWVIRARSRIMAFNFWDLSTFLINGGLFVLVGMQIPRAVEEVTSTSTVRAWLIVLAIAAVLLVTRLAWIYVLGVAVWAARFRMGRGEPPSWRLSTVAAWAGFRGAVSLAAALAVPLTTAGGQPVRERDLIIFCTALAILLIMLVQGTTLPLVVRWAGLTGDQQREDEVQLARLRATEAGLAALPDVAERLGADEDTIARIRAEYESHLADVHEGGEEAGRPMRDIERRLRLAVLEHKRREILRLRNRKEIDDIVLRDLQAVLDIEEIRLTGPSVIE